MSYIFSNLHKFVNFRVGDLPLSDDLMKNLSKYNKHYLLYQKLRITIYVVKPKLLTIVKSVKHQY